MSKIALTLLSLLLLASLGASPSSAQLMYPENHYLVYEVVDKPAINGPIVIRDQFYDDYVADVLILDKFANPVRKNDEEIYDPLLHQTWWLIDDPHGDEWEVLLENQFGTQLWNVLDGRYLVVPALKEQPGELPPWNHYKCYDAVGDPIELPVELADQWGINPNVVLHPELFCNPCQKETPDGGIYPIVEPLVHMACYRVDPIPFDMPFVAFDQFGIWSNTALEPWWLCVPSDKLYAVGTETSTWSDIKELYRD